MLETKNSTYNFTNITYQNSNIVSNKLIPVFKNLNSVDLITNFTFLSQKLCSSNGYFQTETITCDCDVGYFEYNCSVNGYTYWQNGWTALQVIFSIIYFIISAYMINYFVKAIKKEQVGIKARLYRIWNCPKYMITLNLIIACVSRFIYLVIDPFKQFGYFNRYADRILHEMILACTVSVFFVLLLIWFGLFTAFDIAQDKKNYSLKNFEYFNNNELNNLMIKNHNSNSKSIAKKPNITSTFKKVFEDPIIFFKSAVTKKPAFLVHYSKFKNGVNYILLVIYPIQIAISYIRSNRDLYESVSDIVLYVFGIIMLVFLLFFLYYAIMLKCTLTNSYIDPSNKYIELVKNTNKKPMKKHVSEISDKDVQEFLKKIEKKNTIKFILRYILEPQNKEFEKYNSDDSIVELEDELFYLAENKSNWACNSLYDNDSNYYNTNNLVKISNKKLSLGSLNQNISKNKIQEMEKYNGINNDGTTAYGYTYGSNSKRNHANYSIQLNNNPGKPILNSNKKILINTDSNYKLNKIKEESINSNNDNIKINNSLDKYKNKNNFIYNKVDNYNSNSNNNKLKIIASNSEKSINSKKDNFECNINEAVKEPIFNFKRKDKTSHLVTKNDMEVLNKIFCLSLFIIFISTLIIILGTIINYSKVLGSPKGTIIFITFTLIFEILAIIAILFLFFGSISNREYGNLKIIGELDRFLTKNKNKSLVFANVRSTKLYNRWKLYLNFKKDDSYDYIDDIEYNKFNKNDIFNGSVNEKKENAGNEINLFNTKCNDVSPPKELNKYEKNNLN